MQKPNLTRDEEAGKPGGRKNIVRAPKNQRRAKQQRVSTHQRPHHTLKHCIPGQRDCDLPISADRAVSKSGLDVGQVIGTYPGGMWTCTEFRRTMLSGVV